MSDPNQLAFIGLQRTAGRLMQELHDLLKPHGLTPTQFNVLRILRGAGEPLNCTEISARMIKRDPDMTRLLDRMERRGWIKRQRTRGDRRVVLAGITKSGLSALAALDKPVVELRVRQFSPLSESRKAALIKALNLLEAEPHPFE